MGRRAMADDPPAEGRERDEDRVRGIRGRGAGGENHVRAVRPAQEAAERALGGRRVICDVGERDHRGAEPLDLGRERGLEARPAGRREGLIHDRGDAARRVRADIDDRPAGSGDRRAAENIGRGDQVRARLDARDERSRGHELPVEQREDAEPVDPVQLLQAHRTDADGTRTDGVQVDPRLVGSADLQARPGHGDRQADRRVVLVDVAVLGDQERDRACRARPRTEPADVACRKEIQVRHRQPPALRPALARDRQVAGDDRTDEPCRGLRQWRPRHDRDGPHVVSVARRATIEWPYPRRARAASIARRV